MTTKELLLYFAQLYEERYGAPYPISWAKDMATVKRIAKLYGAEETKKLIHYYVVSLEDPFVAQNGHKLQLLSPALPKIVAGLRDEAKKRPNVNPDYERILAARSTQRGEGDID